MGLKKWHDAVAHCKMRKRLSRKSCSVPAISVNRILPSSAAIFNCPIFSGSSLSFCFSLAFKSLQYFLGLLLLVKISITSITEKYHFSCSPSQRALTFLSSNIFRASCFSFNIFLCSILSVISIF